MLRRGVGALIPTIEATPVELRADEEKDNKLEVSLRGGDDCSATVEFVNGPNHIQIRKKFATMA
jgi:hypothetical protein